MNNTSAPDAAWLNGLSGSDGALFCGLFQPDRMLTAPWNSNPICL
jgi:hypothetical protein